MLGHLAGERLLPLRHLGEPPAAVDLSELPSCIFFGCRAPYFSSPDSNGWAGFSSAKKAGKKKRKRLDYVDVYGEQVCCVPGIACAPE